MAEEADFDAFWLYYLRAHSRRLTRLIHYAGVSFALAGIAAAIWAGIWWWAALAVLAGYLISGAAHYAVQGNRPVLLKGGQAVWWSLASALRMYFLGITGMLGPELKRAGVRAA